MGTRRHRRDACAYPDLVPGVVRRFAHWLARSNDTAVSMYTAKMSRYRLQSAYLPQGWTHDVHVTVSDEGLITEIGSVALAAAATPRQSSASTASWCRGCPTRTVTRSSAPWPATRNTGVRHAIVSGPGGRPCMGWRIASRPTICRSWRPSCSWKCSRQVIPRWRSSTTCTGKPAVRSIADANPLWEAIGAAAAAAGIGLTFLPTLYQCSDFGAAPLKAEQARFALETEAFLKAVADRSARIGARCRARYAPERRSTACARYRSRHCGRPASRCAASMPPCRCTSM